MQNLRDGKFTDIKYAYITIVYQFNQNSKKMTENNIQESHTRIKLLTSDIQIKDQTIAILSERLQELEDQYNQTQKAKDYMERQFQILSEEHDVMFENQQKKVKQLQQFNQQLLMALKEVQDKNQEMLEKVKYQAQEIAQKQQASVEVQEQVTLIKDAVKGLEEELTNTQKKYQQQKKVAQNFEGQLKQIIQERQNKDSQLQISLKSSENENQLLRGEIDDYRERLEQQHNELAELKFVKMQFEDLSMKHEQLNEQFNIQVQTSIEFEKNFNEQISEMNHHSQKLEQNNHVLNAELSNISCQNQQLDVQVREYQKLYAYIQAQINETIEDVLAAKTKKLSVHERLYEGRKSSNSSRKSVPKKKKNNKFNSQQIEEFFADIKEIIQSLISTNSQLKEWNDSLKLNLAEMHKVGEQLRFKIDQLNNEHLKSKDAIKMEHQLIVEQQHDQIVHLSDSLTSLQSKVQEDYENMSKLLQQCESLDEQIIEKNKQIKDLQLYKIEMESEYQHLKQNMDQLQQELEEMIGKSVTQNRLTQQYQTQLTQLQNRVYQLDQYIGQLEQQLEQQQHSQQVYEEKSDRIRTEGSPSKSITETLHNQLAQILSRKNVNINKAGSIVKQII